MRGARPGLGASPNMFDNIMYIPRMKTRLLSEEPSGIKYVLINQIFKEIVNFLRIGKKQKPQN